MYASKIILALITLANTIGSNNATAKLLDEKSLRYKHKHYKDFLTIQIHNDITTITELCSISIIPHNAVMEMVCAQDHHTTKTFTSTNNPDFIEIDGEVIANNQTLQKNDIVTIKVPNLDITQNSLLEMVSHDLKPLETEWWKQILKYTQINNDVQNFIRIINEGVYNVSHSEIKATHQKWVFEPKYWLCFNKELNESLNNSNMCHLKIILPSIMSVNRYVLTHYINNHTEIIHLIGREQSKLNSLKHVWEFTKRYSFGYDINDIKPFAHLLFGLDYYAIYSQHDEKPGWRDHLRNVEFILTDYNCNDSFKDVVYTLCVLNYIEYIENERNGVYPGIGSMTGYLVTFISRAYTITDEEGRRDLSNLILLKCVGQIKKKRKWILNAQKNSRRVFIKVHPLSQ